ncbi:hypothetical protein L6164_029546 [Bauhinia variegata]|uniref:Uncharacterized protein n=1 Tax=Bauhinia variegata TaxID=167791 RepID=A0ACB9LAY0_BAUVA|nr:hypothetical protein L6164_029546 [Bauhinia variegata]
MKMASFAGNIGFKASTQLHSRAFLLPWVVWKSRISCSKSRDYSSSGPVRYIPTTTSKVIMSETSPPVKSLEKNGRTSHPDISVSKIDDGKDVQRRVLHYEDSQNLNEMHDKLLLDDSEQDCEKLEEVQHVVEDLRIYEARGCNDQDSLQMDKCTIDAEESAIHSLAARALTVVELRKKLLEKRFSPDTVEAVVNNFKRRGLINDKLYAEAFSRSRWSSSSWGPRRIKQALFKKGVSQDDAKKAVELVFKGDDDNGDQKSSIGMSKQSMDHLYLQASKQWYRSQDAPKETRKSRIIRWLQYRGFNWDVISIILKKLDSQNPP